MAAQASGLHFDDDSTMVIHRLDTNKGRVSVPKGNATVTEEDIEAAIQASGVQPQERDFRKRQVFKGKLLWWLAYQSVGVIYGDIGTSPLYVYSSTFSAPPSADDLVGALSIIIWTLTLIVTIKYVCIVLRADDEGEGGTFAMFSLLSRYSNITKRDPKSVNTLKLERYTTNDIKPVNRSVRSFLEKSRIAAGFLNFISILGVSLIMADGVLTPAQSVLGAIQGLEVATPGISNSTIIGVSCAILILLFVLQPLGIHRLASGFAPVVIIWLLFNAIFGVYNLAKHDASVLKAFSPYFAGNYFVRNKTDGWLSLGGILLAFTGVEALFADLGAFSRRAVQMSWLGFAYPCLLLAYIGQAAYIMDDRQAYSNPFFNCVPPGMFYPSLVISILAAIVASQAIITGTFQLLSQTINMSYFPQITMFYTSKTFHGQIYIPVANWLLMIGTVVVTAVFSNTTRLGNAYGVCVILVTFITTCMITLVAIIVWRIHPLIVFLVWLPFATLDGLYLSAVMTKVPNGAWFTLMIAFILTSLFILWRYGKSEQWKAEAHDRIPASRLIICNADGTEHLTPSLGGGELTRIKGMAIFFDKVGDALPIVYAEFLQKFEARPEIRVFFHIRALQFPTVPDDEKYTVTSIPHFEHAYRVVARHGYNDEIVTMELGSTIYNEIRKHIIRTSKSFRSSTKQLTSTTVVHTAYNDATSSSNEDEKDTLSFDATAIPAAAIADSDPQASELVGTLDRAFSTQVVYIVGKEQLRIAKRHGYSFSELVGRKAVRRFFLNIFLFMRENTRTKVASMKIPIEKLVEIGFVKELLT